MNDNDDFKEIKAHLSGIVGIFAKGKFINYCIDKLKDLNSVENLEIVFDQDEPPEFAGKNISNTYGIYMFWADFSKWKKETVNPLQNLIAEFSGVWDDKDNWGISKDCKGYGKFPKAIGERIEKLFDLTDNGEQADIEAIPFYLGKAENVATRVKQHFNLEATSTTYALKLNERASFFKGIKFTVAWLALDVKKDEYFIVDKIESELRKKLNPIIGKQ